LIRFYNTPDFSEFVRRETQISRKGDRLQPELGGTGVAIHMYMGWFAGFMAIPEESIRALSENCWHQNLPIRAPNV